MKAFRFIAGVSQETGETLVTQRLVQGGSGLDRIDLGPSVSHDAQDQMVGRVADGRKLGITAFVVSTVTFAAFCEVG